MYDKIPEPSDDENDMLDLAFGLTETWVFWQHCEWHSANDVRADHASDVRYI